MSAPHANVPSHVLRVMYDHALAEKSVWEGSRAEHTIRLASAVSMVAHWDKEISEIGLVLESRGQFSEFPEDAAPPTEGEPQ
jgi:hypothetical protein